MCPLSLVQSMTYCTVLQNEISDLRKTSQCSNMLEHNTCFRLVEGQFFFWFWKYLDIPPHLRAQLLFFLAKDYLLAHLWIVLFIPFNQHGILWKPMTQLQMLQWNSKFCNALIISGKLSALEVFYLIVCQHDTEKRLAVASRTSVCWYYLNEIYNLHKARRFFF